MQNQSLDVERDLDSVKDTPGERTLHELLFPNRHVDFVPKHPVSAVVILPHHEQTYCTCSSLGA